MSNDSHNSLAFHKLDASNVDELAEQMTALRRESYGDERDPLYWRWCYVDNPGGGSSSVVAVHSGRAVGNIGSVHVRFAVSGAHVVAGLICDLGVLDFGKSWRCLSGLVERCFIESAADGLAFGYAFVARSAAELTRRLGGVSLGRVPMYTGFLNAARVLEGRCVPYPFSLAGGLVQPLVRLRRRSADIFGLDIRPVERFDQSFDGLWHAAAKSYTVASLRDAAYLNWRYVDCPGRRYARLAAFRRERLEGLIVFRLKPERRTAFVLELLARSDAADILMALLLRALDVLDGEGIGLVTASFPAGSAEGAALCRLGFQRWAGRFWGIELLVAADPERSPAPELRAENWYFSLGDWLAP